MSTIKPAYLAIKWNRKKALDFLAIYKKSHDDGDSILNYEGHEFVVEYANYMLEYFVDMNLLTSKEITN
jgi:hypothetical protein